MSPALLSGERAQGQRVTSCKGQRTRAVKIEWHTTDGAIWGFYHCMLGSIVPLLSLLAPPSQFHPCDVIVMPSSSSAVCTDAFDHNNFSTRLAARFPGGDSPGPGVVVFHGRGFLNGKPSPGLLQAAERAGLAKGNKTVWKTRHSRGLDGLLNTCYLTPVPDTSIALHSALSEALKKAAVLMRDICGCGRPREREPFTILVEQRVRKGESGAERETHIVNFDAMVEALSSAFPPPAFRVHAVQLAKMTLCEQVCTVSLSSVLVGIHGAALLHVMFLQPRAVAKDSPRIAGVVEVRQCHFRVPPKTM